MTEQNQQFAALPKFEIVFLDMDDVLCDWMIHAVKFHDTTLERLTEQPYGKWKPGDGRMAYEIMGLSKRAFWAKIDEAPNFWHDLPKSAVFDQLRKIARSLSDSVQVLTKPHQHENCFAGKHHWCAKHLYGIPLTLTESKHLLAKPGRLLIDDREQNVEQFRAAGGSAILFPQHWNSAHDKAPFGPLFYLAQELAKLAAEQNSKKAARTINEARLEDYLTPTEPRPDPYVVKRDDNRWPHDIRPRGTWEAKPEADSPLSTVMQAAGDMAIGTQDTSDQPDHPATLLGYPVLPADPDSELAKKIAAMKPGDIVLGPSLSASRGPTKQEMEDETWGIGR